MNETPQSLRNEHARAELRAWLIDVMRQAGIASPAELARITGVSPSTLSRALDERSKFELSTKSIRAIVAATGIAAPSGLNTAPAPVKRPDASPYSGGFPEPRQSNTIDLWQIETDALDLAGVIPGDVVEIDRAQPGRAGDIVIAQCYDLTRDSAETVFRIYEPPFLLAHSTRRSQNMKPMLVDDRSVVILGVITRLYRALRAS